MKLFYRLWGKRITFSIVTIVDEVEPTETVTALPGDDVSLRMEIDSAQVIVKREGNTVAMSIPVRIKEPCHCWYVFDRNEGRTETIRQRPREDCPDCGGTGDKPYEPLSIKDLYIPLTEEAAPDTPS